MCTGFSRVDSMTDELVYRKRKDTLCFPQCGPYENENRQRVSVTFNRFKIITLGSTSFPGNRIQNTGAGIYLITRNNLS
jgi:hypothetical protein